MFGRMASAFRPAQNHPGLLLCDGEHRDNATRLTEYERRVSWLKPRAKDIRPEGAEIHEYADELDDIRGWWERTGFTLNQVHHRTVAGIAFQARTATNTGSPKLDALVYELHIKNTLRNKRALHGRLLRSIK